MLRLLENPNLMEHERFTDLLWAVLHLEEELEARTSLADLSPADEAHLELDVRRAYNALMAEWLLYVEHLKADYPYLFSLVVRMHPFQEAPSPGGDGLTPPRRRPRRRGGRYASPAARGLLPAVSSLTVPFTRSWIVGHDLAADLMQQLLVGFEHVAGPPEAGPCP